MWHYMPKGAPTAGASVKQHFKLAPYHLEIEKNSIKGKLLSVKRKGPSLRDTKKMGASWK